MSIHQGLLGAAGGSIITAVQMAEAALATSGTATVSFSFQSNGNQSSFSNGSETIHAGWVTPTNKTDEWEIRATLASGDTPDTGNLNVWEALSTTRSWSFSQSSVGSRTCDLTFEFRPVGGSVATTTITTNVLLVERLDIFS